MDAHELIRLRQKYQDAKGDDIFDPAFKQAAASLFHGRGQRKLPYAGISTFLDAPYQEELTGLDIALIGVPMDLGVTNRPGARFGPRAVREIERVGPYNHQLRLAPHTVAQIADIGDVPFRSRFSLENSNEDIAAISCEVCHGGARPLSVGGDESTSY